MKKLIICGLILMISATAFGKRKLKIIYSNPSKVKAAHNKEIKRAKNINLEKYLEGLKKENSSKNTKTNNTKLEKKVEVTGKNKENTKNNSIEKVEMKEQVVYITKSGKKYHKKGCRYSKHARAISLKRAKNMGLKPCKVCRP